MPRRKMKGPAFQRGFVRYVGTLWPVHDRRRLAQAPRLMPFSRRTDSIAAPCCLLATSDIEERAGDEGSIGAR